MLLYAVKWSSFITRKKCSLYYIEYKRRKFIEEYFKSACNKSKNSINRHFFIVCYIILKKYMI